MILIARDLKKSYHSPTYLEVLSGLSLDLRKGESVAICGRSGEGKSTLLRILGTLEAPDSGQIEIEGVRVTPALAPVIRRRSIGFIFQSFNLLEDFTALDNVLMPAKIIRRQIGKNEGLELLDLVGLSHRADFPAKFLSGGERQRVAIARALCNDPALILADEPTGNLDGHNAVSISDLLFSLVHKKQKSLILATHDLGMACHCDKTLNLSEVRRKSQPSKA